METVCPIGKQIIGDPVKTGITSSLPPGLTRITEQDHVLSVVGDINMTRIRADLVLTWCELNVIWIFTS